VRSLVKKESHKMILAFYKKGKLSIDDIADAAEVSVEYIIALAEQAKK
jgi:hypothetical protein